MVVRIIFFKTKKEGATQLYEKIVQLKLEAANGKLYNTDCANTETMFRIIQSIPSPKAEPFKAWLAQVGYERIQEIENPELAAERARQYYRDLGNFLHNHCFMYALIHNGYSYRQHLLFEAFSFAEVPEYPEGRIR